LVQQAIPLDLEAGAILYPEEGDPRMALVISGLLRVYLTSAEGREITIRYARDGDVLGTVVTVAGPVRTPVQAVTDSRVLLLSVAVAQRLAETDASLAWAFAQEIARRLYDVLDELAGTAFASVRARVARHLLDLSHRDQETGRLTVTATQQEICRRRGIRSGGRRQSAQRAARRAADPQRRRFDDDPRPCGSSQNLWRVTLITCSSNRRH
jgi:CRP/FNR family transcriptional regulator